MENDDLSAFDETFYTATVAFLHLPKCAGQSVAAAFQALYPVAHTHRFYPPDDVTRRGCAAPAPRLVVGHFVYGFQHQLSPSVRTTTVLRHPVDRLLSQVQFDYDLHYSDYGERFPELAAVYREARSVESILRGTRLWIYDNCMVRMLSGVGSTVAFGALDEAHLELAWRHLRQIEVLGFVDQLDRYARAVKQAFGYPEFDIPWNNSAAARGGTVLLDHDLRRLEAFSSLDLRLYYAARQRAGAGLPRALEP